MAGDLEEYPRFIFGKTAGGDQKIFLVDADGKPILAISKGDWLSTLPISQIENAAGQKAALKPVQQITLHASGPETASITGSDVNVEQLTTANFYLDVTAASGTTPTLDVKIQEKDPVSGKYFDLVSFTQATAITSERKNYGSGVGELLGKVIRFVATIGGTTPSFTFSLSMVGKS